MQDTSRSAAILKSLRLLAATAVIGLTVAACSTPEQRAEAHYRSGIELLDKSDYARASLEFRNALKLNDKLVDAWRGLATVGEKTNDWAAVQESLERIVELDLKDFDSRLKLARLQLAAIKLDAALRTINAANAIKKDDSAALALRAAILLRLNDAEGARADAEKALAVDPNNADAMAVLGADALANGKIEAALQFIDRGLKTDPDNIGLLLFKLKVHDEAKDYANVEAALRRIIEVAPNNREIRGALVQFLVSQNRKPEAEAEMRAMADAAPDDAALALELVRFVSQTRGADAGRKELQRLIAAHKDVADFQLALAQLDFIEKRTTEAFAPIEAIIAKGQPAEDVRKAKLLLASMHIDLGEAQKAGELVDAVLADDANNADGLALRAKLKLDAGQTDGAVADLRDALNQKPEAVSIIALLARAYERQGSIDLASERYIQAVKTSRYEPALTLEAVRFLTQRSRRELAESLLTEAAAMRPRHRDILAALAEMKLSRQDWQGAEEIATRLKSMGDTSGLGERLQGAVLFGQQKFDESIEMLKSASGSSPGAPRAVQALVLAYVKAGKIDEAEKFTQSVLDANPNNVEAIVIMGSLKTMKNQPAEAEVLFKKAIDVGPTTAAGYAALARLYATQSMQAEAEAVLRSGHEKLPGDAGLGLGLAGMLESRQDIEGAIAIYEKQLAATPNALVIANNLASLLADYRSDADSLERAQTVARVLEAVDVPQFQDTLGWIAYRRGEYRNAASRLEQAAAKLPKNALVRYHLGMTYAALKRPEDARKEFAEATANASNDKALLDKIAAAQAELK